MLHPRFPPPRPIRSLDVLPNNLPAQLTSFIGRDQELEQVAKLLRRTRLLTIAGVGGSGKTRLALQLAVNVLDHYRDGVWLAELAPVAQPEGVLRAVAASLGLPGLRGGLGTRVGLHGRRAARLRQRRPSADRARISVGTRDHYHQRLSRFGLIDP